MAFINEKKVNWDLTTPNSGLLLKEEYEQLYDNDNYLKTEVERVDTDLINHEKDYFTYGIVQGFEVTLSAATGSVDVSEGIARDQAGRRMQRSAETGYGITDGKTVKVICRFTDTEIIIDDISASQAPADNELVLAQVTRSGEAVTIVDERTFAGLVVNNIDHPQGVLVEGERVAKYKTVFFELALSNLKIRSQSFSFVNNRNTIIYINGAFITLGVGKYIYSSNDGIIWTENQFDFSDNSNQTLHCCDITYGYDNNGNGIFVTAGYIYESIEYNWVVYSQIKTSSDGSNWLVNENENEENYLYSGITYGGGFFVAVGYTRSMMGGETKGFIKKSSDGINWEEINFFDDTNEDLLGITYANSKFVIVGSSGKILFSIDGSMWNDGYINSDNNLVDITYGNGLYVAVGESGTVLTSLNGISWKERNTITSNDLYKVTYANGLYVAVGENGFIQTSINGIDWIPKTVASVENSGDFKDVIYNNGRFVIVGDDGIYSTDPIDL